MEFKKRCGFFLFLIFTACVTEPKPEDNRPYVATVPTDVAVKTNIPERGDAVPGSIVVKCRTRYDNDPKKNLVCGPSTVKITNELSKASKEQSFKGDKVAVPVAQEASYAVEVKTKGCDSPRGFLGMTVGMVLTVQFENCGGTAVSK